MKLHLSLRDATALDIAHAINRAAQEQTREQWLSARKNTIGGSEAAAILGEDQYKSAYTLWAEKAGEVDREQVESEAAEWGTLLEPVILRRFEQVTKRAVHHWPQTQSVTHRDIEWMTCTPDGLQFCRERACDGWGVAQVKCTGHYMADDWRDGPPLKVQIQIQHEMAVCNAKWGTIIVLVGGNSCRHWDVDRNDDFIEALIDAEHSFRNRVLSGDPPPLDPSESTRQTVRRLHPDDNGETVELPERLHELAESLRLCKQQRGDIEKQEEWIETQIKAAIGGATYATIGGRKAFSYKTQTRPAHQVAAAKFRVLRRLKGDK